MNLLFFSAPYLLVGFFVVKHCGIYDGFGEEMASSFGYLYEGRIGTFFSSGLWPILRVVLLTALWPIVAISWILGSLFVWLINWAMAAEDKHDGF
ncbi:MAG: hypothetical protein A3J08_01145 [Candidatus Lloydbacteria bacterium RIFCSPLOWO2_02_FULL_51_11]|uniref:Uncharacterized protein n=1 Tax=Candidatus Lloydbacteria bacterium RIFCSPLOWO2_02_FULL_51_11 TaxID=1798667 RepID=A0A1G2DMR4_9BACT|nr:MAG: hypothetical protein A3J08_01145 [Candidatus Lloydbacteria bacterium RIFCSPLOWO2_02_FULL_51_11]